MHAVPFWKQNPVLYSHPTGNEYNQHYNRSLMRFRTAVFYKTVRPNSFFIPFPTRTRCALGCNLTPVVTGPAALLRLMRV